MQAPVNYIETGEFVTKRNGVSVDNLWQLRGIVHAWNQYVGRRVPKAKKFIAEDLPETIKMAGL